MTAEIRPLGRLERVSLRDVWMREAVHFTPWLASDENIELLGDVIGLELEVEAQEKEVGPFRADILCKDTVSGNWVLVENQLERTDHTHLGQLLTYAAGLQAVTVVWIAERFTEEHRAALDWLNQVTADHINFFGLEIEVWRIGDSRPAPKFNLVSKPNDWSKSVATGAHRLETGELTDLQQTQLAYWQGLAELLSQVKSPLRHESPRPQSHFNFALGRTSVRLTATRSRDSSRIWAGVIIQVPDLWTPLLRLREDLERDFGCQLVWDYQEGRKQNYVGIQSEKMDLNDRTSWPQQFTWLQQQLERFLKVFGPRVKTLNPIGVEP